MNKTFMHLFQFGHMTHTHPGTPACLYYGGSDVQASAYLRLMSEFRRDTVHFLFPVTSLPMLLGDVGVDAHASAC